MVGENGVTITLREIYDSVQEVAAGVRRLDERITRLEEKTRETDEVDERSRKALQTAEAALEEVKELKAGQTWLWRTIAGALITGAIGALFYFVRN